MARIVIYSTGVCPICDKTKSLLQKWGITYEEKRLDQDRDNMREFSAVTQGARTVPQLTLDGVWIGGFTELTEMHMEGQLDPLMTSQAAD